MSQHSQRTQHGPSRISIVAGIVIGAAVIGSTSYIGFGAQSWRELAGFGLGLFASVLMIGQVSGRVIERNEAQARQERDAARVRLRAAEQFQARLVPPTHEDDQTRRLVPPPLRAAPVFVSEGERARWMDDKTEVIRTGAPGKG